MNAYYTMLLIGYIMRILVGIKSKSSDGRVISFAV